jgi:putative SOS response-associated peptidase YedK
MTGRNFSLSEQMRADSDVHSPHRVPDMCGRFSSLTPPGVLARIFDAEVTPEIDGEEFHPNYNVAPSTRIFVIASSPSNGRRLGRMQWGLVPHWAKPPFGTGQINARSETIGEKPTFRDSYRKRRCVIPMTGYYEWRTVRGVEVLDSRPVLDPRAGAKREEKRAVYVTRRDGQPLAVAGLWSIWTSNHDLADDRTGRDVAHREGELQRRTCCVVTRDANTTLATVHDRMPVVLEKEQWPVWLGENGPSDESDLQELLGSDPDSIDLSFVDVSTLVNSVRNNGPELIVPVC